MFAVCRVARYLTVDTRHLTVQTDIQLTAVTYKRLPNNALGIRILQPQTLLTINNAQQKQLGGPPGLLPADSSQDHPQTPKPGHGPVSSQRGKQSRLDQRQRLLHPVRVGPLDGLQENGRPGRGPREDLRAGAVLREVDAGPPHGDDAAEGQSREVQDDPESVRFVARQVFVADRCVSAALKISFWLDEAAFRSGRRGR